MLIDSIKKSLNAQEKRGSAIMTLIISLVIVTPLCGFLFQCGCDWPWLGLDTKCNFYKPHAQHQCPWCASMITGILSIGTAMIAGVGISLMPVSFIKNPHIVKEISFRVLIGLITFILVAVITAKVAALWQGYPM